MRNNIANLALKCFSAGQAPIVQANPLYPGYQNNPSAQSKQPKRKEPEEAEKSSVNLTPILDKTQIKALTEDGEIELPKSLFDALHVDEESEVLLVQGLSKLTGLWKILHNLSDKKDWVINKFDPELCNSMEKEARPRANGEETLNVLATISDTHNHHYVFWIVNPSITEGVLKFKLQEQTFGQKDEVSNTSVSAIKYKDGDEEIDLDIQPIIDEFAKEDKAIQDDYDTLMEASKEESDSASEEEEDWGWDEGPVSDEDEEEGTEEEAAEGEEEPEEESSEQNFSRIARLCFS